MRLSTEERILLDLYRKANTEKQCEALRVLDENTIICLSIYEYFQYMTSLRNRHKEMTGD